MKDFIKKEIDCLAAHCPKLWRRIEKAAQYVLLRQRPPRFPDAGAVKMPVPDFYREEPAALARRLADYDIISFDVFDTLVFRAFDEPKMIFRLWGLLHEQQYAYDVRRGMGRELRAEIGGEVTLRDIYRGMERHFGIPAEQGMADEIALEMHFCRPNPYMLEVYDRLREQGKRIVVTSDMYLPKQTIAAILERCGYAGWEALYVSCECQCTKSSGAMWTYLNELYPASLRRIHVGDNQNGDVARPKEAGWDACHYQNVHQVNGAPWKSGMTRPIGSLWRGLVDEYLYAGRERLDPYFDLGFVYFGLPIYGYCQYLHEIAEEEGIGLILFAARDMRAVWEVYRERYDTPCEYVPISRTAIFRADFAGTLENVLTYAGQVAQSKDVISVGEFFGSAEWEGIHAPFLLPWLERYGITKEDRLSLDTYSSIQRALQEDLTEISAALEGDKQAAIHFYRALWERHGQPDRILFADLNGRGTCLSGLRHIFMSGDIQAHITGAMLYTAAEASRACDFLDRSLRVYGFSGQRNADMLALYNQLREEDRVNIMMEESAFADENGMLLSYTDGHGGLLFQEPEMAASRVRAIREGVIAFSREFARYCVLPGGRELHIPGRDVFWPLMRGAEAYSALTDGQGKDCR